MTSAALVNTAGPPDRLTTVEALDAFLAEHRFSGSRTHDEAELADVRAVRARLRRLWNADLDELAAGVNGLLAEASALPRLVRHGGWDYHLHATSPQTPLATRVAVETAMALVDVVRAGETSRLRRCAGEDCDGVLVDLSRNRSRRYCEGGCGNRANVAAYRARQAGRAAAG